MIKRQETPEDTVIVTVSNDPDVRIIVPYTVVVEAVRATVDVDKLVRKISSVYHNLYSQNNSVLSIKTEYQDFLNKVWNSSKWEYSRMRAGFFLRNLTTLAYFKWFRPPFEITRVKKDNSMIEGNYTLCSVDAVEIEFKVKILNKIMLRIERVYVTLTTGLHPNVDSSGSLCLGDVARERSPEQLDQMIDDVLDIIKIPCIDNPFNHPPEDWAGERRSIGWGGSSV